MEDSRWSDGCGSGVFNLDINYRYYFTAMVSNPSYNSASWSAVLTHLLLRILYDHGTSFGWFPCCILPFCLFWCTPSISTLYPHGIYSLFHPYGRSAATCCRCWSLSLSRVLCGRRRACVLFRSAPRLYLLLAHFSIVSYIGISRSQ